jgi:hypothetical protein
MIKMNDGAKQFIAILIVVSTFVILAKILVGELVLF